MARYDHHRLATDNHRLDSFHQPTGRHPVCRPDIGADAAYRVGPGHSSDDHPETLSVMMVTMYTWAILIALAAIVARITYAITRDDIAKPLRTGIGLFGPAAATWVSCPWCIGLWISAGIYAIGWAAFADPGWDVAVVWAGAACAANLATAVGIFTWESLILALTRTAAAAAETANVRGLEAEALAIALDDDETEKGSQSV